MAQSVYSQDADKALSNVSDFKSSEKLQRLVPSMNKGTLKDKALNDNEMSILSDSNRIFPKSKVSDEISPIFKGSAFDVESSKKRSSDLDFSSAISGSKGATDSIRGNKTFKTKELPEVTIPPELQEFFDKKNKASKKN